MANQIYSYFHGEKNYNNHLNENFKCYNIEQ